MTTPIKLNLKIIQGSTFGQVLRWETGNKIYKTITSITNSAPVTIYATAHGIPVGWRTRVTNVGGMKEINCTTNQYYLVTGADSDSITLNAVNSLGYSTYTTGGVLEYNEPVDLTDYTARMQIRSKLDDVAVILELTTENGGIVIDNTTKTIQIVISAEATAAFTFTSAVYSLELVTATTVIPFAGGTVGLVKEVTR